MQKLSGVWPKLVLLVPLLLVLGFAELGRRSLWCFELKREVRIGDITSACTTVALAYALQYGLARRTRERDALRDLVKDHVQSLVEVAGAIQPAVLDAVNPDVLDSVEVAAVLGSFTECQDQIGMLLSAVDHCQNASISSLCNQLDQDFITSKAIITNDHPKRVLTGHDVEVAGQLRATIVKKCQAIRLKAHEL